MPELIRTNRDKLISLSPYSMAVLLGSDQILRYACDERCMDDNTPGNFGLPCSACIQEWLEMPYSGWASKPRRTKDEQRGEDDR